MTDQLVVGSWQAGDLYTVPTAAPAFTSTGESTPSYDHWTAMATDGAGTWVAGRIERVAPAGRVYSTDDTASWTVAPDASGAGISEAILWHGDRWYASTVTSDFSAIFRKSDDGVTWTDVQNLGDGNTVISLCRWQDAVVALMGSMVNSYCLSEQVIYTVHPEQGVELGDPDQWHAGGDVASTLDRFFIDNGVVWVGTPLPNPIVANDDILIVVSTEANTGHWTDSLDGDFTACTYTGTGSVLCAAWDGSQWVGGGHYDSGAGVLKLSYATSADGKAWTHTNVAAQGEWSLVDIVYDGTSYWFTAVGQGSNYGSGAVFKFNGVATWTRYDCAVPLGVMAGAPDPYNEAVPYSVSIVDSVGVTDAVAVDLAIVVGPDTVGVTDAVASDVAVEIGPDAVGVTDSIDVGVGIGYSVTITDNVGVTDEIVAAAGVNIVDNAGVTDELSSDLGVVRVEPVGVIDHLDVQSDMAIVCAETELAFAQIVSRLDFAAVTTRLEWPVVVTRLEEC